MIALALCLLKAYKIPVTAIRDRMPMRAKTASISIILLPDWHRWGAPFLNRFINLNCLKNAAKRPLSFVWGGGGNC